MEDTKLDPTRCCERVSNQGGWHSHQCHKAIKVTRDGKGYCTVHDPVKVKAKRDESYKKYEEESNKRFKQHEMIRNYSKLVEVAKEARLCLKGTHNPYWKTIEQVLIECGEI